VVLIMVMGSLLLVLTDHEWAGTLLGGSTLVSVTTTYIIGTRMQHPRFVEQPDPPDST